MQVPASIVCLCAFVLGPACSRAPAHERPPATGAKASVAGAEPTLIVEPGTPLATPREVDKGDGCKVQVLADGNGALLSNGIVASIHYTARVKGAETPFASTKGWYQPLAVPIAAGLATAVVPGLVRGLEGLRVGSRARIEVPPALAYGQQGAPAVGVPADATLVFEVDVVGVR